MRAKSERSWCCGYMPSACLDGQWLHCRELSRRPITAVLEAADAACIGWDDAVERSRTVRHTSELLQLSRGEHQSVLARTG